MLRFLQYSQVKAFSHPLRPFRLNRLSSTATNPEQPVPLYGALRDWRTRTADELRKPLYYILSNKALETIAAEKPTTLQQLADIPGIGPAKLKSYGSNILKLIKASTETKPEPPADVMKDEDFLAKIESETNKKSKRTPKSATSGSKRQSITMMTPEAIASMNVPIISMRELNEEQRNAATLALSGNNIFLTGTAGTGKTFLLKFIIQELVKKHGEGKVAVTAPTGISAITVGGQTVHSFAGIGLGKGEKNKLIAHVKRDKQAVERWKNCDVLIIDEISMLGRELFELLDAIGKNIRENDKPFGGLQLLVVGDFLQLPPVQKDSDKHFCFQSPIWDAAGLNTTTNYIKLNKVERQNDEVFIKHLNDVRIGKFTPEFSKLLDKCLIQNKPRPSNGIIPTKLYAINKEVDSENTARLAELPGEIVTMEAEDKWKVKPLVIPVTTMKTGIEKVIPEKIDLKVGAQVILLRNRNWNGGASWDQLVNGSRGKIIRFEQSVLNDGKMIPIVHFDNGIITSCGHVPFEYRGPGGDGVIIREQVPLRLAWASTIHKSQGCTLTCAELMLSSSFDYGQAYVALSRVKGLEGLWLTKPVKASAVKAHPAVLEFYGYK